MFSQISKLYLVASILLFVDLGTSPIPVAVVAQSSNSERSSLIEKFWQIGCEFSGVVSRVRRSVPQIPEPDYEDPEELFQYLYPLADVDPARQDDSTESQRSFGPHSLSSWLEDLMELWHSECNLRRNKRSTSRRGDIRRRGQARSNGTPLKLQKYSEGRNSSIGISSRNGYSESAGDEATASSYESEEDHAEVKEESEETKEVKKLPDKPADAPAKKAEDIFFSQYGGDIEYFFPLISFGIPFDGEITLLGFHGFRGLFPY